MSTGKQNPIKKKLSELKEVPEGFHFDKAAAWKEIEFRLNSRSVRQGPRWLTVLIGLFNRLLREIAELFTPTGKKKRNRDSRRNRRRMKPKLLSVFTIREKKK